MAESARPTHVYVGAARWTGGSLGGVFRRKVGDDGWVRLTKGLPEVTDVQAITVSPSNPDTLYAGTQRGPYRSLDRGERWERLDFPDDGTQVWSILVHPADPRVLYAGTSPVGVFRSDDAGETWRRLPGATRPDRVRMSFPCRVMRLAIDAGRPEAVYAAVEVGGAMGSLDGGETWQDCSADLEALAERPDLRSRIQSDTDAEGMLDAHALCVTGARPDTVFLAVRMGLFRSPDRGRTWHDMQVGRFSPFTYARDVRVSPHDPRTLYACLSPASRSHDGSLYRSRDLGETWTRLDHGIKAEATMMAMALDPRDAGQIHCVARTGQVFATGDGGGTWEQTRLPTAVQDVYAIACG